MGDIMQCEMCGRRANELFSCDVEGTTMQLCSGCCEYGNVRRTITKLSATPIRAKPKTFDQSFSVDDLVEDYGLLVRKQREKRGLTQKELAQKINMKESEVHHIEQGKFHPPAKDIASLERFFGIRLTEHVEASAVKSAVKLSSSNDEEKEVTVGDMINIKVRKKKKN